MTPGDRLLEVSDLRIYYHSTQGEYKVVDGVNLTINRKEILGLAGESGCGKSTVVEGILRLVRRPGYIKSGAADFFPHLQLEPSGAGQTGTSGLLAPNKLADGVDLMALSEPEMRQLRWKYISYIPQASMNSLNPVLNIENQMVDAVISHSTYTKRQARERAAEVLELVRLPASVAHAYPHELSGGMKQRAIIAIAMTLNPQLVIADEPTTALDVNVQRAILEAILAIKEEANATVLFVSHDLAVHAELVDRIAIMYAGKIVEVGSVGEIFKHPLHPYSQRLIASVPTLGGPRVRQQEILGQAPDRLNWPTGCRFHPRCPFAMEKCKQIEPHLDELGPGHWVACHLYDGSSQPAAAASEKIHHASQ
ncbi:MAG: ABC transporter ATP-binding protein [Aggregatilineales bacterium]